MYDTLVDILNNSKKKCITIINLLLKENLEVRMVNKFLSICIFKWSWNLGYIKFVNVLVA